MTDSAWTAGVRSRLKVKKRRRRRDGEKGKRETGRGMVVEVRRRAAACVSGERGKRSRAARLRKRRKEAGGLGDAKERGDRRNTGWKARGT